MNRGQRITFLAGSAYLIGALLPWVVLTTPDGLTATQNALALPNGIFVVSIGALLLVTSFAYRGRPGKPYSIPLVILSAATAFLLAMIAIRLNQATGTATASSSASLGPGMILCFASTLIGLIGGAYPVPAGPAKK